MEGNQRISFCAKRCRVLKTQGVLQLRRFPLSIIPLLASHLTGTTSNAFRNVDQGRLYRSSCRQLAHSNLTYALLFSCALTTLTRQAFVSWVPAPGSTASIVR